MKFMIATALVLWAAVLIGASVALQPTYAQDTGGMTVGGTPPVAGDDPPIEPTPVPVPHAEIPTGSIFGPIYVRDTRIAQVKSAYWSSDRVDIEPLDGTTLQVPEGAESAITFYRVTSVSPTREVVDGVDLPKITVRFCGLRADEVVSVEDDSTHELRGWRCSRFYLRSGGFAVGLGAADGDKGAVRRWAAADGLVIVPALVKIAVPKEAE